MWLSLPKYGDESHTILGAYIWKSSRDKMKKETPQSIEKIVFSILQMLLFKMQMLHMPTLQILDMFLTNMQF